MASIRRHGGAWQARVRRKGYPETARSFTNRKDAETLGARHRSRGGARRLHLPHGRRIHDPARSLETLSGGSLPHSSRARRGQVQVTSPATPAHRAVQHGSPNARNSCELAQRTRCPNRTSHGGTRPGDTEHDHQSRTTRMGRTHVQPRSLSAQAHRTTRSLPGSFCRRGSQTSGGSRPYRSSVAVATARHHPIH